MTAVSRRASDGPSALAAVIDAVGSVRAVEVLRIAAGPIVIAHLWPYLSAAADGLVYSDRFYHPYADWYPEAPRGLYLALLWLAVAGAVTLSLGLATRASAIYTASFVGYNLFLSRTHFWHNRAFLLVMLIGLALLPVGRALSLDAVIRRRRGAGREVGEAMLWPLYLMRFEVVATFMGSGLSKLLDQDWWGGTVTRLRIVQWRDVAAGRGMPDWLLDALVTDGFHWWFAKFAVLVELSIALGLVWKRTRMGAIWIAVLFHVTIEIIASVQVFSAIALAALVIWVTPRDHDRRVIVRRDTTSGRVVAGIVRFLDWTGRFELAEAHRGSGPAVQLVNRSGVVTSGRTAMRIVLSRLPATFVLAAPFNLPPLRRLWDGS